MHWAEAWVGLPGQRLCWVAGGSALQCALASPPAVSAEIARSANQTAAGQAAAAEAAAAAAAGGQDQPLTEEEDEAAEERASWSFERQTGAQALACWLVLRVLTDAAARHTLLPAQACAPHASAPVACWLTPLWLHAPLLCAVQPRIWLRRWCSSGRSRLAR